MLLYNIIIQIIIIIIDQIDIFDIVFKGKNIERFLLKERRKNLKKTLSLLEIIIDPFV